jgi:hypothetical protein
MACGETFLLPTFGSKSTERVMISVVAPGRDLPGAQFPGGQQMIDGRR